MSKERELVHDWQFPQKPGIVWEYLTKAELLTQWLMQNDIQPVVGHKFNFHTQPMPQAGFNGIVDCEVIEVVPQQKLSYSWKGGDGSGNYSLDTILTWTLTATPDGGTNLHMVHAGFKTPENDITFMIMNEGWGKHIQSRLGNLLNARNDA